MCLVLLLLPVLPACAPATEESLDPGEPSTAWIVFGSARTGNGDLYAVDPRSGETILVAGSDRGEGSPRFDAARERIVFQRFQDDDDAVLVATGREGQEPLFADPSGEIAPAWSPTGDRIVYGSRRDGTEALFLARADGTGETRLTAGDAVDRYPTWHPDGDRIAFARRLSSGWDAHVLDLRGPEPVVERVTWRGAYLGHLAWSSDGSAIAFDTTFDDDAEIAIVTLATGEVRRLTERAGNDLAPAWSPDGRTLAFGGEPDETGNWDVWTVDLTSGAVTRLTTAPAFDGAPVWVPAAVLGR